MTHKIDYATRNSKYLIVFILFMSTLSGTIFILNGKISSIMPLILFFIIVSYANYNKISLTKDTIVFTYGYIPKLKIKRVYKYDRFTNIYAPTENKYLIAIKISYTTDNDKERSMIAKRSEVYDFDKFVKDVKRRTKNIK